MAAVTTSNCEAKYISACHAAKEHMATVRNLLDLLGYEQRKPTSIQSDNMGTIYIIKDPSLQDPTVSIQNHHVLERFESKELEYTLHRI